MSASVRFLEDARWNGERDCVEVTALIEQGGASRQVPCAVTEDALAALVRGPGPQNPLRVFSDFEATLAQAATRHLPPGGSGRPQPPEIAITRRDLPGHDKLSLN